MGADRFASRLEKILEVEGCGRLSSVRSCVWGHRPAWAIGRSRRCDVCTQLLPVGRSGTMTCPLGQRRYQPGGQTSLDPVIA